MGRRMPVPVRESDKLSSTICPTTIALQNLVFWQFVLGAVRPRLHHRNCLGIVLGAGILEGDLNVQGPLNGGGSNGGVSRSGLVLPFLSFLSFFGLSRFFWDLPDLRRDGPGIFLICPFPLSQPFKEHLRGTVPKGSATQSGPFPKKVGNTRVWNPPGLASLKMWFMYRSFRRLGPQSLGDFK